ncbi:phage tail protein [Mucilaginibacter angelicae]|uniref:Phage tail protein n=1 Tax=Mucilaginibacter angelicae TaxID=869718 RepID=A0ABV6LF31_9SPHI
MTLLTTLLEPVLKHRFGVFFYTQNRVPNMLDIRFQKVSGIGLELELYKFTEGGQNQYVHRTPSKTTHGNLVLERGIITKSTLKKSFNEAFYEFKFTPLTALIMVFNDAGLPVAGWEFHKVIPAKWSVGALNAETSEMMIESMELSYSWFRTLDIPGAQQYI